MRILLTNNSLGGRAGTELYVRDIAIELMRRGHRPVAYSTKLGTVAEELRPIFPRSTIVTAGSPGKRRPSGTPTSSAMSQWITFAGKD